MSNIDEMCKLVRDEMKRVNERQSAQPKVEPGKWVKPSADELEKRREMLRLQKYRREGF